MQVEVLNEFSDIFPKEQLEVLDHDQIEVVQPLIDLGYITLRQYQSENNQLNNLHKAIDTYRRDCQELPDKIKPAIQGGTETELSGEEATFIQSLTCFEHAQFSIPKGFKNGVTNLHSRILHFRLNEYGYQIKTNAPLGVQSIEHIEQIKSWFSVNQITTDKLMDLLGDPKNLTDQILDEPGFTQRMIYFKSEDNKVDRSIKKNNSAFKKVLKKYLPKDAIEAIFAKENVKTTVINEKIKEKENQFLTRLLQIRLWMLGDYEGKIDADFGPVTVKALQDFLEEEELNFKTMATELKAKKSGKFTYGVINILEVLRAGMDNLETEEADLEDTSSQIESESENNKDFDMELEIRKELKSFPEMAKKQLAAGRRVFVGGKNIASGLSRGINRIIKFIGDKLQKLKKLAKKLARYMYVESKQGLNDFFLGMSFLLGKRTLKTQEKDVMIISKFDFDFDQITLVDSAAKQDLREQHSETEKNTVQEMGNSLSLVAKVFEWVATISKLSTPAGWISLVLKIVGLVKEAALNKKQQLATG